AVDLEDIQSAHFEFTPKALSRWHVVLSHPTGEIKIRLENQAYARNLLKQLVSRNPKIRLDEQTQEIIVTDNKIQFTHPKYELERLDKKLSPLIVTLVLGYVLIYILFSYGRDILEILSLVDLTV